MTSQTEQLKESCLKTAIIFLLFLSSITSLHAQELPRTGDIRGYVKDARSGEALPYANVVLKGTSQGTMTTTDGYFVLVSVPTGICSLQVSYIGYETKAIRVDHTTEQKEPLLIEMTTKLLEVEGVMVTAYREEMLQIAERASLVVLAPEQLTTLPSIGEVDIFRSLQLLPGISGISDGSSGLYVRGGTPDQNLILFDGMTIYHVDHFFGFFSAFNADAIKNVQVFKGAFPAKYGGRLSSVVNLTGKTGDRNRVRFGVGANLLSANASFEYPLNDKATILLAGRRSYTDFIQSSLYNKIYDLLTGDDQGGAIGGPVQSGRGGRFGGGNIQGGEFRPSFFFYDMNGKLSIEASPRNSLSLSFYSGADDLDKSQDFSGSSFRSPGTLTGEETTLQTSDFTRWGNLGVSGQWTSQWHDRFRTNLQVAGSRYFSEYNRDSSLNTSFGSQQDSIGVSRGLATASEEDNRVEDLTYRLSAEWDISRSHRLEFGTGVSGFDARYIATLNDTLNIINRSSKANLLSGYIQDTWRTHRFVANAGLRATQYEHTNKTYLEPRASLTYYLTEKLRWKSAWGHHYQFVNRIVNENVLEGSRDFWILADDELKPGFSEHVITGLEYATDNWLFSFEAYRKDLDNLVEFTRRIRRQENQDSFFYSGSGLSEGIELLAQKKRGFLTGWIGYTSGKVEHTFPAFNNGEPFPADHDRRHEINAVIRRTVGDWTFAATWTYATGKAYTAPVSQYSIRLLDNEYLSYIHVSDKNAYRLPDYHRLDVSASRKYESGGNWITELGVSVFNLYNHRNVWYREYQLDTNPITVTDTLMLGFTPTVFIKFSLK